MYILCILLSNTILKSPQTNSRYQDH